MAQHIHISIIPKVSNQQYLIKKPVLPAVFFMILLRERKTFSVKFERSKHLGKNLIGTYVSFDLFGERIFAKFSIYKRWSLFTGVKGIFRHLQWLARKPLAAPRQSSTAPNGTEISESNDDLDESAHIAKFYVELFDKLIKANDITELSFYFSDRFSFLSCWSDYYYNRGELLEISAQTTHFIQMNY